MEGIEVRASSLGRWHILFAINNARDMQSKHDS